MPIRILPARAARALLPLFLVLSILGIASPAAAQDCPPEDLVCEPGTGGGTAPVLSISPASGSRGASVAVTITWSSSDPVVMSSFVVRQDNQEITSQFTSYQTDPGAGNWQGTVAVASGQSDEIRATLCTSLHCGTTTVTYTGPPPAVRVTPENASMTVAGGSVQAARFRVVNTGTGTTVYSLAAGCTNTGSCTLSGAPSTLTLAGGDSTYVDVSFQAPASGSAQARLTASSRSASSQGATQVTALAEPAPGFPGDSLALLRIERAECVTVAVGPAAALECGDLRMVHALPGVRELNRARAPVLVYNSQHARPYPIVAEQVTPRAGTAPDTIRATLTLNGVQTHGRWPSWAAGTLRHVALTGDGAGLATGLHPYTIEVRAHWNSGASEVLRTRSGRLLVVNRGSSPFGAGWWMAGAEQLHSQGDTLKLWVGGDGSARLYRGSGAAGPWVAESFTRPDTLWKSGTEYVRVLPGRAKVRFDASGNHVRTVSRLGDTTHFRWASGRLARVVMPRTPAMGADSSYYLFEYANNAGTATPRLSKVRAPWLTGFRDVQVTTDSYARVTAISDPYLGGGAAPAGTPKVQFGYVSDTVNRLLMRSRTDRRNSINVFSYYWNRFHTSTLYPAAGDTVQLRFWPAENHGTVSSAPASSVQTRLDGPRGAFPNGVADRRVWRVNRWGAPVAIQSPTSTGWVWTYITRGDPRWPGQVTKTVAPNGFTTSASYDGRGNLLSQTSLNPYGDGRNATTTYQWNAQWDAVTQVTAPEGEVSLVEYDSVGRRLWEQVGPGSARRVGYTYLPKTHTSAPGRLSSVVHPGGAVEQYEYDARGNLSATVSPIGFRSSLLNDRIGRVVRTRTPIDSLQTRFRADTTVYDVVDQVLRTESWGAINGTGTVLAGSERAIVVNEYDLEGNPLSVSRWAVPDTAGVGTVTTRWEYDAVGRKTAEIAPDGTPTNLLDNPRDTYHYDRGGNLVRVVTRRRAATLAGTSFSQVTDDITMEYDVLGQLVKRRTPAVTYPSRNMGIAARRPYRGSPDRNPPYPLYPNNGSGYIVAADSALFQYHVTGGITSANNNDAQVSRTYFPNGQVSGETQRIRQSTGTDFTAHQYTIDYTYDRNGRPTGVRHPTQLGPTGAGNDWNRYTFDVTGALETVTDALGNVIRHGYYDDGSLARIERPENSIEQFTYDLDGQRRSHTAQTPQGYFRNTRFGYDGRGKLVWSGNSVMRLDTMSATYSPLGHAIVGVQTQRLNYPDGTAQRERTRETSPYDGLAFRTAAINVDSLYVLNSNGTIGSVSQRRQRSEHFFYESGTGRLRALAAMSRDTFFYDVDGNTEFNNIVTHVTSGNDRASYYGADGRIAAADYRNSVGGDGTPFFTTFEEYRYDALGRRIWVRSRRYCEFTSNDAFCRISKIRRTVWDGDREFYEIQMPGGDGSTQLENDTALTNSQLLVVIAHEADPNPFYGRVAYAYGHAIDQPLSIVRMGYEDLRDRDGKPTTHWTAEPFATFPLWSHRGQADLGHYANGATQHCISSLLCVRMTWPAAWFDLVRSSVQLNAWHGTLLEDKADATATLYRRNRVYDARTGQFTQEDPIGLAGGLNSYGFAGGDPVSYSDPYGLCPGLNKRWWDVTDCPPGYFTAIGMTAGAFGGGIGGGMAGAAACSPTGPGALVCAGGGAMAGAKAGAATGAFLGSALDAGILLSRAIDGTNGSGESRPERQRGETSNFRHAVRELGLNRNTASDLLHELKRGAGLRGADNVWINTSTGAVRAQKTGEIIGHLTP